MSKRGANPDEQGITLAPALQFGAEPEAAAAPGAASEPGAPRLQVAKGEAFSTEADFKRRQDSAEAWAATQGLPFEQALAKFNADMIARGYTAASPETISVLQWYEQIVLGIVVRCNGNCQLLESVKAVHLVAWRRLDRRC